VLVSVTVVHTSSLSQSQLLFKLQVLFSLSAHIGDVVLCPTERISQVTTYVTFIMKINMGWEEPSFTPFTPNKPLLHLQPATTELPLLSTLGGGRKSNLASPLVLNMGHQKIFLSPVFTCLVIAACLLAFCSVVQPLPAHCLMQNLYRSCQLYPPSHSELWTVMLATAVFAKSLKYLQCTMWHRPESWSHTLCSSHGNLRTTLNQYFRVWSRWIHVKKKCREISRK
jgi:hypothetical protein